MALWLEFYSGCLFGPAFQKIYRSCCRRQRLAFAIYVNNVPFESIDDMMAAGNDLGSIAEAIYTYY
jgi:hypothetical protein